MDCGCRLFLLPYLLAADREVDACVGVRCVLVETRHPAHAKELVAALPVHELELYDGILAVSSCLSSLIHPIN